MKGAGRFWGSLTNAEASRAWLGAIAQLGERVLCKHEVVGSIPIGSTIAHSRDEKSEARNRKSEHFRDTNDGKKIRNSGTESKSF